MHIANAYAYSLEIVCQILCHLLGKCCYKHLAARINIFCYLGDQVIYLTLNRSYKHLGIQKPRRPDDLLSPQKLMLRLISGRCGRNEQHLIDFTLKFIKTQRSVVQRRRQAEAVVHQRRLSGAIAVVHRSELRDGHMRLVYDHEKFIRKVVDQSIRRLSRRSAHQMSGIVLDSGAKSGFSHHLHIKMCSLIDSLRLKELVMLCEVCNLLLAFFENILRGDSHFIGRYYIVRCRKYSYMAQLRHRRTCEHINLSDPLYLVPEKLNTKGLLVQICGKYLQRITSDSECASVKIHIISGILDVHQLSDDIISVLYHARAQ